MGGALGRALFRAIIGLLNLLPRRVALGIGAVFGAVLYRIVKLTRFKDAVSGTIRTAFGDELSEAQIERMARKHARDLLRTLVEVARFRELPRLVESGAIEIQGESLLRSALDQGRGAVLLSAHMGNWELLICLLGLLGYPVHAVVVRQSHTLFNEWLVRERERFGSKVIYLEDARSSRIEQLLAANQMVLLLADHHHYGGDARNVVDFFGKPVSVPGGPVAFSTRFGAPLIPLYTVRQRGGRHRVLIEAPLEWVDTGRPDKDFLTNCKLYMSVYERWIRAHPDQWMWSHERWAWLDENMRPVG